jgi:ribose transport system permease protein
MTVATSRPRIPRAFADYVGMLLVVLVIVVVFGTRAPNFLSMGTFRAIANEIPGAVLVATGMTFVVITGGIDLSVGSVLGLSGAVLGLALVDYKLGLPVGMAACLATGLACGAVNGIVTTKWAVPSFIVTLGMLEMARGGAYLVTNSQTKYAGGPIEKVASASVMGLALPFVLCIVVVALGQFLLSRTVFGRYVVAVGTNEEAVRLSGIDTRRVKRNVFMLGGFLAAGAAILNVSRLASADPNGGTGIELQAIAAVVIGGTSLMGGRGSVVGSFFGVLIIALLENGLAQVGAQEPTKRLITGAVIVLAVIVDQLRVRLRRRTPQTP